MNVNLRCGGGKTHKNQQKQTYKQNKQQQAPTSSVDTRDQAFCRMITEA